MPKHTLCIAPMMDYTDRHDRYFLRLISRHVLLYTEMVTTQATHVCVVTPDFVSVAGV